MTNTFTYKEKQYSIENAEYDFEKNTVLFNSNIPPAMFLHLEPECFPDKKITFQYNNTNVEGTVEAVYAAHCSVLPKQEVIIKAHVKDVHSFSPPCGRLAFRIPHLSIHFYDQVTEKTFKNGAYFGDCDHAALHLNNHQWILRDCYKTPADDIIPLDIYVETQNKSPEKEDKTNHSLLEIELSSPDELEMIEKEATIICCLLGIAKGRRIMWDSLWQIDEGIVNFCKTSHLTASTNKNDASIIPDNPDCYLYDFIEKAYTEYKKSPEWWDNILWNFTLSNELSIIETSGMIQSILLERICSEIYPSLSSNTPQIGNGITECLNDEEKKKKLTSELHELFEKREPNWTPNHSHNIIETISRWNVEPSYLKKIGEVLKYGGFSGKINADYIRQRHQLLHTGKLNLSQVDGSMIDYFANTSLYTTSLVLAMLNYKGFFFALGNLYDMNTIMPQADKLRHSSENKIADPTPKN